MFIQIVGTVIGGIILYGALDAKRDAYAFLNTLNMELDKINSSFFKFIYKSKIYVTL